MTSTITPGVDLSQDRSGQIYAVELAVYPVALTAVILRVIARKISNTRFWFDDWFIFVSFVFSTAAFSIVMLWLKAGVGKHVEAVVATNPNALNTLLKEQFAAGFIYPLSITFAKYSILAFYWRIFKISRSIHLPIYIITGINTAWCISFIMTTSFECIPNVAFWDLTVKGRCIDLNKFFVLITIPNVITDIFLLVLPLPYIWRLQIKASQKALIAAAFIMGGLTCVISIVRLAFIVNLNLKDITWGGSNLTLYTGLETYCAVICACLPSLRPLFKLFKASTAGKCRNTAPHMMRWNRRNGSADHFAVNPGSWTHLQEQLPATVTQGSKRDGSQGSALRYLGPEEMHVTTEVSWRERMV